MRERKYQGRIEVFEQMRLEEKHEKQIIADYIEMEDIDNITEEEMTNLFGDTYFNEHVYWYPRHIYGNHVYTLLTDYEQNQLDNGYDPILGEYIDELDRQVNEPWIEWYDSLLTLEDNYPCAVIDVDDFIFELVCELKKRHVQAKTGANQSDKRDNSATILKYENWISILNYIDGFLTSQEIDVLDKCISGYASVCTCPYERRKEIRRNLWYQNSCFDIDLLEFESKIYRIDVQVLFELAEILLELENLFYCSTNSDNNFHSSSGKHDWPISTFYYCWEIFEIDRIQWYEIQAVISLAEYGLIKNIWNSDHVIYIMDEHNAISTEYDYYINQFNDDDHHNLDKIDIGDLECLTEDDLFKDTWLVEGMKLLNSIDYIWEAEITNLCQTQAGDFYTDFQDGLSEQGYWNYSKYRCYQDGSGFFYCNKDSCDGCTHSYTEKVLNQQFTLWQRYVQPIELDE